MSALQEHPGSVRFVDHAAGSERTVPADELPLARRFVFLANGRETRFPDQATERIPIVRVDTLTLDDAGQLVSRDEATQVHVISFGPGGRRLRLELKSRRRVNQRPGT